MAQSPFTVEKLLRLPVMQDAKVVGGFEGLTNEIRCVDIMEIPDLRGWLRKGEFVLTTGYSFHGNPQGLCNVIEELHHVGGAAIGFKPKRFLQATPQEAIDVSNAYGLPLIEIPPAIPYIEITQPIMEQILNVQLTMMREVYDINSRFVNLLATQRGQELLNVLGQLLGCEAALLTPSGSVEIRTSRFGMDDVQMTRDICVSNITVAHVALTRVLGAADVFESMCLDQVVALMSLGLTAKDNGAGQGKRAREEFLVELLSGSLRMEGILVQRARQLEFPQGTARCVMLMDLPDNPNDMSVPGKVQQAVADWLNHSYGQRLIAAPLGEQVVMMCADPESMVAKANPSVVELARAIHQGMKAQFNTSVILGIGEVRQELRSLSQSYEEAKRTLDVCRKVHHNAPIVHWNDIYVEDMLLSLGEHPTLERLYTSLIFPIHVYDMENSTDLLRTLDTYVHMGGNTKQVAAELYIHRNSVHYRLERIQDILGRDLNDPELLFRLNIAIRAWKLGLVRHL